jgi:Tfp pilus assembly ATPase PilU
MARSGEQGIVTFDMALFDLYEAETDQLRNRHSSR